MKSGESRQCASVAGTEIEVGVILMRIEDETDEFGDLRAVPCDGFGLDLFELQSCSILLLP
jgi:hypothetical protein